MHFIMFQFAVKRQHKCFFFNFLLAVLCECSSTLESGGTYATDGRNMDVFIFAIMEIRFDLSDEFCGRSYIIKNNGIRA